MPNLNTKILSSLPFIIPPLPEQRRIAEILGALDGKIELNRKMNKTLEEMAQAIFKSWFIDFDGHDDLVESELGAIPRGWEVGHLSNHIELAYGKSLPKRKRAGGKVPVYGSGGIDGFHDDALVKGPGIIVGRKGTVGSVMWENRDFFPIDTTFFVKMKTEYLSLEWAYFLLKTIDIQKLGADSAVPGVNRNTLLAEQAAIPPVDVADSFSGLADSIMKKQSYSLSESATLSQLRDTLLPKLISGEIRVPEAEEAVEEML